MSDFDRSQFIEQFKAESREYLQQISRGLLALEREPADKQQLEALMRSAHSFKGSAALMGYKRAADIAHKMEDGLEAAFQGRLLLNKERIDLLLKAMDLIAVMIEHDEQKGPQAWSAAKVQEVLRELENISQLGATLPAKPDPQPLSRASELVPAPAVEEGWVRVRTGQLNKVINLSGEVFIAVRRLKELVSALSSQVEIASVPLPSLYDVLQDFRQMDDEVRFLSKELWDEALALRMVPAGYLLESFERAIRDLANAKGKEIVFRFSGESTPWDKAVMDQIREPVLHLLLNAVDHGIETPAARQEKGKPAKGELLLSVFHEGTHMVLEVQDDGAGVSLARVRETAVRKHLVSAEEMSAYSDDQLYELLFRPGFSTKTEVSEVSGRGVGLNIVLDVVSRLKGVVAVESHEGQGTRFILRLPLTLAIAESLLVAVGQEVFALPVDTIEETIRIKPEEIVSQGGQEFISIRGERLLLLRLSDVFRLPSKGIVERWHLPIVVAGGVRQRIGLVCDEIVGRQDIVHKSLGELLQSVPFVAGATILNNGRVSLVLDVPAIIDSAGGRGINKTEEYPAVPAAPRKQKKILVAEDVFVAAMMEKDILESAGYAVVVTRDGKEALFRALQEKFDAVITDVVMPHMDGFDLIVALRKEKDYQEVPIIVLTTRQNETDKRRGLEAGANAYLLKGEFSAEVLLENLERLLG